MDCENKYQITEYQGVLKLNSFKIEQKSSMFIKPSFDTISASGANAAMLHYIPTSDQHDYIAWDKMYMVDQGGQ